LEYVVFDKAGHDFFSGNVIAGVEFLPGLKYLLATIIRLIGQQKFAQKLNRGENALTLLHVVES
jgi:hypothetical protein